MHIVKIELEHVQALTRFTWELQPNEAHAGWHVFLGDNGAGKSSLLKAVAMSMLPDEAIPRASLIGMIQQGKNQAKISTTIKVNAQWDSWTERIEKDSEKDSVDDPAKFHQTLTIDQTNPEQVIKLVGQVSGVQTSGFFSASFGPYCRFAGASRESEKLAKALPNVARHLLLIGDDVAMLDTLAWLQDLHYRQLDEVRKGISASPVGQFLQGLRIFINQDGFLPNGAKLHDVHPHGVDFCDADGAIVDITALGDGFCAMLRLTMELLRQLVMCFGMARVFNPSYTEVMPEGVVLVDEIEAHLHPTSQRAIGPWLTSHFPNMQFLVSTHSPFVCQAAIKGTVTGLPELGNDDAGGRITGNKLDRLLYGNILEAMSSGAFGEEVLTKQERLC